MSDEDQVILNLGNQMSGAAMAQARALFDEIVNINTKISIMKGTYGEANCMEEVQQLRVIRKYLKDRIDYYQSGGQV